MTRTEIILLLTKMMYENNLIWGKETGCVVDSNTFKDIPIKKQASLMVALERAAFRTGKEQLSLIEQHKEWMITAPENHPSNKPYEDLSFEERVKDVLFKNFAVMLAEILSLEEDSQCVNSRD